MEKIKPERFKCRHYYTGKISFLYLIHCPMFFLHSTCLAVKNAALIMRSPLTSVQHSIFILFVITPYPLRLNTNVLLQLDLNMKVLVCMYIYLPPSFPLTFCKTLAQDVLSNFCIQLCCEQHGCGSIFQVL